jgi:hypothetical protein
MRTRMKKLALPLSLLALGALGLNACGGGDDDEGTPAATAAPDTTAEARFPREAKLSREQAELKRAANDWASVFATNSCNSYMGEPLCARLLPVSKAFQKSFADATVEDIKFKGSEQSRLGPTAPSTERLSSSLMASWLCSLGA